MKQAVVYFGTSKEVSTSIRILERGSFIFEERTNRLKISDGAHQVKNIYYLPWSTITLEDIKRWNKAAASNTVVVTPVDPDPINPLDETDPLWSASPSSSISSGMISNWNNAFGWGNHASVGYLTPSSAANLTNKTGNISQWTNDSNYITPTSVNTLTNKSGNISQWTNDSNYATQAYADALVVGLLDDRGNYNPSSGLFPSTGGSGSGGAVKKGDVWILSADGNLGVSVKTGQTIRALIDTPGQTQGNWGVIETNIGFVPLARILPQGQVFIGNSAGFAQARTLYGAISAFGDDGLTIITPGYITDSHLASDAITTIKITNDAVTFAKTQNISTARILGRNTAGTGDIEELGAVTVKDMLMPTLQEVTSYGNSLGGNNIYFDAGQAVNLYGYFVDGNEGNPAISFLSTPNTGFWYDAFNAMTVLSDGGLMSHIFSPLVDIAKPIYLAQNDGWVMPTGTLSKDTFNDNTVTLKGLAQRVSAIIQVMNSLNIFIETP